MTRHELSPEDVRFRGAVESCRLTPAAFNHRAHVRLAYVYLAGNEPDDAAVLMRDALVRLLAHHGIDASKYHETMTKAWILAVRHFMERSAPGPSADAFIDANPMLLDTGIMLTHYSADLLFSPEARAEFVEPDLEQIPRHVT